MNLPSGGGRGRTHAGHHNLGHGHSVPLLPAAPLRQAKSPSRSMKDTCSLQVSSLRPNASTLWPWGWPFLPFRLRHNRSACSQNRTAQPAVELCVPWPGARCPACSFPLLLLKADSRSFGATQTFNSERFRGQLNQ